MAQVNSGQMEEQVIKAQVIIAEWPEVLNQEVKRKKKNFEY